MRERIQAVAAAATSGNAGAVDSFKAQGVWLGVAGGPSQAQLDGFKSRVLRGAEQLLRTQRPFLYLECAFECMRREAEAELAAVDTAIVVVGQPLTPSSPGGSDWLRAAPHTPEGPLSH